MLKFLLALLVLCLASGAALWFHAPLWSAANPVEVRFSDDTRVQERETLEKTYTLAGSEEARITIRRQSGEPYTSFIFQSDENFTWTDGDYGLPQRAANQTGMQQTRWFPARAGEDFTVAIRVANNGNADLYETSILYIEVETRKPEPDWLNSAADWLYSLPVLEGFAPQDPA